MGIQYQQTARGQNARLAILKVVEVDEMVSRKDLMQRAGLTYDQVRRQTRNLVSQGAISSSVAKKGKRLYQLRNATGILSVLLLALNLGWAIPMNDELVYTHAETFGQSDRHGW